MMPCIIHFLTLNKKLALLILHFVTYIQYEELSNFGSMLKTHCDGNQEAEAYVNGIVKNNAISFYVFNLYALGMVFLYDVYR